MDERPALRAYQQRSIDALCEQTNLDDKHILELGGHVNFATAQALIGRGAKTVTVINSDRRLTSQQVAPNIKAINLRLEELKPAHGRFDVVFGVAVLEHLYPLGKILKRLHRVMPRGAIAFLLGGPVWTSDVGHHLWVKCADGTRYRFTENNPVPDWGHLLFDEPELIERLTAQGLAADHVERIARWVYHSDTINRYTLAQFEDFFERSRFKILNFDKFPGSEPDPEIRKRLASRTGLPGEIFSYRNISVTLQRTSWF